MRILLEIWPALIPIAIYLLWRGGSRRRAGRRGAEKPGWLSGPGYWLALGSALAAVAALIALGVSAPERKGVYTPPHMENGVVVPGKVTP